MVGLGRHLLQPLLLLDGIDERVERSFERLAVARGRGDCRRGGNECSRSKKREPDSLHRLNIPHPKASVASVAAMSSASRPSMIVPARFANLRNLSERSFAIIVSALSPPSTAGRRGQIGRAHV